MSQRSPLTATLSLFVLNYIISATKKPMSIRMFVDDINISVQALLAEVGKQRT